MYDYLIVGAGLFGSVFAREALDRGKSCLVIDRRAHVGGNAYCENIEGINVHMYGAHIFHTSNKQVWDYVRRFVEFNRYTHTVVAKYSGELFNLPFNMNTFNKMWGVSTPDEAKAIIAAQISELDITVPRNLREQALCMVGSDIFEKLIDGYTEKQWGRSCSELPTFIIKRLPLRFTFDNSYFNDPYQGIPIGGYNPLFEKLLDGADVRLGTDYDSLISDDPRVARKTVFTGPIDEFFHFCYGPLAYRSLRFENEVLGIDNFQGCSVMNFTERDVPYTRIIEHKHFEFGAQQKTVITYEFTSEWELGDEPFYPVNDEKNNALYRFYLKLAGEHPDVIFGGRLGSYRYFDMDKVIESALSAAAAEFG